MDFADMTPDQLAATIAQAQEELLRRQNNTLLDERLAEVQDEFRNAGFLRPAPDVWDRPGETRDAFGRGDVVEWGDGKREATAGFVVCSPDCDEHWIDYVELDEPVVSEPEEVPAPEVTPWSADMGTVAAGTYVSYQERTFLVRSSHVAQEEWTPPAMPALFEEV